MTFQGLVLFKLDIMDNRMFWPLWFALDLILPKARSLDQFYTPNLSDSNSTSIPNGTYFFWMVFIIWKLFALFFCIQDETSYYSSVRNRRRAWKICQKE
jgi:hypothetical protein